MESLITLFLLVVIIGLGGGILSDLRGHRNGKLNTKLNRLLDEEPYYQRHYAYSNRGVDRHLDGNPRLEKRAKGSKTSSVEAPKNTLPEIPEGH